MIKRLLAFISLIVMMVLLPSLVDVSPVAESRVFEPIQQPTANFGTGWTAEYYNNTTLSPPIDTTRAESIINFDFGTGAPPNTGLGADMFSIRFRSTQFFQAGTYEFAARSDDGIRVFIDNQLVLDRFVNRPDTTDRFQQTFPVAGNRQITVEYFDNTDIALVQFQWFFVGAQITPVVTVTPGGPTPTPTPIPPTGLPEIPPGALSGTVVRATVLLVREAPFFSAPVVGRVRRGQTYQVIGRDPDARWFLLQLSGFTGWVWGFYLNVNGNEFNAPVQSPFITQGNPASLTGVVGQTRAGLRLRAQPTTASPQTGRIPWGDILPIIGRTPDGGWYQVVFRDTVGWVAAGFVGIVEGDLNVVPIVGG
ncbi:MAG: SH3 domain-containing protein [Chloroflexi bacterium]|nr:SH3 domain-containing protein [Chloroflexota bacterium]